MQKFQLRRYTPSEPNFELVEGEQTYPVLEFEPSVTKKYMISVDVGDWPPQEVMATISRVRSQTQNFFPPNSVLYVPCRNGHPAMAIYELCEVDA